MKNLLLPMAIAILLSMPVIAMEEEDPCASQPQEEKCQVQEQEETKYRHDHRDQKGIPHSKQRETKAGDTSVEMKKAKTHDHKEVHK